MTRLKVYQEKVKKRLEIIETIKSILLEEQKVIFAFLHGSFCSEQYFRDVDVGIFVRDLDPSIFSDYELKLSQQIEKAILFPYPVEVKIINNAPLSFCFSVLQGRLLFTRDEELLISYMTEIARKYLDFAPLRHHYMIEAMK
jgi:hypothetical protein